MQFSTRRNWPLISAVLLVVFALGVYAVGWPLIGSLAEPAYTPRGIPLQSTPLAELVRMRLFEALIAGWFFVFGASLGSFMNVVVFRSPRGLSLLGSSFCPKCGRRIRWHDNLPVFGWLHLRGRCRDCELPIASRYPLVELITGLMLLAVAIAELFLDGANLPGASDRLRWGVSWLIVRPRIDLVATYAYHAALLCSLLTWTLIRWDGFRLPKTSVVLAILLGFGLAWAVPAVHPVAWTQPLPAEVAGWGAAAGLLTPAAGGLLGALLGAAQSWIGGWWRPSGGRRARVTADLAMSYAVVGIFLGWQAAVSVGVLAASSRVLLSSLGRGAAARASNAAWPHLTLAVLVQILAWKALDGVAGWPGSRLTPWAAVVPVLFILYLSLVAAYVEQRRTAE